MNKAPTVTVLTLHLRERTEEILDCISSVASQDATTLIKHIIIVDGQPNFLADKELHSLQDKYAFELK